MTVSIDKLAEFVSVNARKADDIDLGTATDHLNLRRDGSADERAARILEYFRAHSIGHYRYGSTLMFELAGDLFVIND